MEKIIGKNLIRKKNILCMMLLSVLLLAGCGKKDEMVSFIPTPTPGEEDGDADEAPSQEEAGDTNTSDDANASVPIGPTTTMYVKLSEYNAVLNVRSTPSKDGEVVGFLVHAEKVAVIETVDGWASIVYDGAVSYVSADFLVEERPEYLEPPTVTPTPKPTNTPKPTATPEPTNEQVSEEESEGEATEGRDTDQGEDQDTDQEDSPEI